MSDAMTAKRNRLESSRQTGGRVPNAPPLSTELAEIFRLFGHPDRIRLIVSLKHEEMDVNGLADALDLPATRVSQHLSILRTHRLVDKRHDGCHRYYRLAQPEIAQWIVAAKPFIPQYRKSGSSAIRPF